MKQQEEFKFSLWGLKLETKNPKWTSIIMIILILTFFYIVFK